MSHVPGRAVRHSPVTGRAREALLGDLATVLQTVHTLDPPARTGHGEGAGLPTDATAAAVRERLDRGFADLTDDLAAHPQHWTLPVSPAQVAARPVVLHSNPGPTHGSSVRRAGSPG